jgi:basic membrane protein A and related proteins
VERFVMLLKWRPVTVVTWLLVSACGGGKPDVGTDGEEVAKVALLTQGPVSDAGWYAGAYEGLQLLRDELGVQISHQQTRTPAEFDEALISYASDGFGLIFAHGFEYQDAALRVAPDYPETTIIVSGGSAARGNVIPLIFHLEEASYLAGMAAGYLSQSGVIGMVGGVAIPTAQGTFNAFKAGALSVDPEVTVLSAWIGSWDDVSAAKEAAVAQLQGGADILIHNTDGASFGVFQAVREARRSGTNAYAMGMNRDQNAVAPEVILGSAIIRIPEGMLEIAKRWRDGTLSSAAVHAGGDQGVVDYIINPALSEVYPSDLVELLRRTRAGIRDGSTVIPRVQFVEGGERPE